MRIYPDDIQELGKRGYYFAGGTVMPDETTFAFHHTELSLMIRVTPQREWPERLCIDVELVDWGGEPVWSASYPRTMGLEAHQLDEIFAAIDAANG